MENKADIVSRLRSKTQRLVWLYENEQNKVSLLESRIESLERQLAQNVARIEETEEKNRKLQLAAAFKSGSTDAQEAKLKIGKIVREIDKCVALLNK
ncbi:MAG: hypothetical protein LBC98_04315 [Prevotellaceae bacterium]|nr:hypothetical protein [Prevotellaceae bacterium]